MRKTYALLAVLVLTIAAEAQTLKITTGNNSYSFSASEMTESSPATFSDGTTLTVNGTSIAISDITSATVESSSSSSETGGDANTVSIAYSGSSATVTIASNLTNYVTASVSGAHVTITQSNTDAVDGDEITYVLSGSSSDGEFALSGSYKCTVSLAGLTLTNPSGAAINITNGKRIQISAKNGTENTLTDGSDGSQKGCIYSKGQIQLQGKGTLNVAGNTAHAIKSGDYITVKNLTLNITSAVKDGINCNEYFLMESGNVIISGVGDDGIQADLDGDSSTGETSDHEDEDSGNIYLEGGTLTVSISASAAKGVKAAGDLKVSDGTINVTTSGSGAYDSDERDAKGCAGLKSDGNMAISGGTLTLKSTGSGGKCIKSDGTLTISSGTISATSSGSIYKYSSSVTASPKAIKSDGNMTISGGTVTASSSNHEGIESKGTLSISGGYVYSAASDDAINSAGDMTISGGYVMANSSGNDGLDANGNCYIKDGNVFAVATSQPEVGIDANTEANKQLYITGGNVVAIGGFENGASISNGTAKSASYSKGTWYALYNGSSVAFAFKVPSNSSMGSSMAVYTTDTPALKSGVSGSGTAFWNGYGYTSASGGSDVSLSTYSSGGAGGGQSGGDFGGGGGQQPGGNFGGGSGPGGH